MFVTYSLKAGLTSHEATGADRPPARHRAAAPSSRRERSGGMEISIPREELGEAGVPPRPSSPFGRPPLSPRRRDGPEGGPRRRKGHPSSPPPPPPPAEPSTASFSRAVRFSPVETVRMVPSRSELARDAWFDGGAEALWYTPTDLLRVKSEAREVAFAVRGGELHVDERRSSSSGVTLRGLERHASEERGRARRERKCAVVRAVLEEQARQRGAGKCWPSNVRMASMNVSWRSRDAARAAAEWDEYAVRRDEEAEELDRADAECHSEMPWPVRLRRLFSGDDDTEEDEPRRTPPPPQSPRRSRKSTAADVYTFDNCEVIGGDDDSEADENAPPPIHYNQHLAPPSGYWLPKQHENMRRNSSLPLGVDYIIIDRHCRPLMEVRPKRSIMCR